MWRRVRRTLEEGLAIFRSWTIVYSILEAFFSGSKALNPCAVLDHRSKLRQLALNY